MPLFRDKENRVKYTELKYCRPQYAQTKKTKENLQNWNTVDVNINWWGKQNKIYRTEILQISTCRNEQSNLQFTGSKYYRCQYEETREVK